MKQQLWFAMEVFNFQAVHEGVGGRERLCGQRPSRFVFLTDPPDLFDLRFNLGQFQFGVQKLTAAQTGVRL